jgi:LysM repeat protein
MGKSNKSTGTQNKQPESTEQEKLQTNGLEKWIPATVVVAIITAVAYIVVALINRSTAITTTLKPIEFTQTAEAFHTSIAMTATVSEIQTQTQVAYLSITALSGTQTALAFESEVRESAIVASQTAEALALLQTLDAQTATAKAVPTLTEIKPLRYEHTVAVGETLKDISKKYFILDTYADSIGRANCNQSPKTGDVLVIRYFYVQIGDTIDIIAQRFGGSPSFLRSINNLSQDVVYPPANQIFILSGKCGN